jgi:3-methyladenine DNA glycosylase AlkD
MDKVDQHYKNIQAFCKANADEALVKKYARYFTEGYDPWGVDGKLVAEHYKGWKKEWGLTTDETVALCDRLFRGKSEEIFVALWFLRDLKKNLDRSHFHQLRTWFDLYVRNWAHCDAAVSEVMKVFFKYGIVGFKDFAGWRTSTCKFTRRAVPVSFIWIVKKDPGVSVEDLLTFIDPLVEDAEKPVRQGMGWFLREAWKKYPASVESYLINIREYAPRLVIQYATEKMDRAQKELYKRTK